MKKPDVVSLSSSKNGGGSTQAKPRELARMEIMQRSMTNLRRRIGNSILNSNKGIEKMQ